MTCDYKAWTLVRLEGEVVWTQLAPDWHATVVTFMEVPA